MNAREEWLQARKSGIGGSDIAAILGVSPFKTADGWSVDRAVSIPAIVKRRLAEFGPELRHALFKKADGGDLVDTASDVPTALHFPKMIQPLKFAQEIIGATVTVAYGLGDIVLETVNVNSFKVECHEGGTVRVTYRVQAKPTGEQLAKLSQMLGSSVDVSIDPPEAANDGQQNLEAA